MTAEQPAEQPGEDRPTAPSCVWLRNRYQIDPSASLSALSSPAAPAYVATDHYCPEQGMFALICAPKLPIRVHALNRLRQKAPDGMLPVVEAGVVEWPMEKRRAMAVVYPRPLGGSLTTTCLGGRDPMPHHTIARTIITPIVGALRGLQELALTHRAIRPGNVFFSDESRSQAVIGDCVSAPPGFTQPNAIEPVERALAMPSGRGEGSISDDLYALGVTLACVAVGRNLLEALDDREFLEDRIKNGSFRILCERYALQPPLTELLRGLLADDPASRWSLDDVARWTAGERRQRFRGSAAALPAPFQFRGKLFTSLRLLADAMAEAPGDGAAVIRSGELAAWLEKRAQSRDAAHAVADAVDAAENERGRVGGGDDVLVARVAMILDPNGPVRYRGFRFMSDGFGPALAVSWLHEGDSARPASVISRGLIDTVKGHADNIGSAQSPNAVRRLRRYLDRPAPGQGLERCLYETNPGLACQSPLIANAYVLDIEGLLKALNKAAKERRGGETPVDHHIAAFLGARCPGDIGAALEALNDRREHRGELAALALLAAFHQRQDAPPLPELTAWFFENLAPVVDTFRSRTLREEVRRKLPTVVRRGRLKDLLSVLDDSGRRQADKRGAEAAAAEYAALGARIRRHQSNTAARRAQCTAMGQRVAAFMSLSIGIGLAWVLALGRTL